MVWLTTLTETMMLKSLSLILLVLMKSPPPLMVRESFLMLKAAVIWMQRQLLIGVYMGLRANLHLISDVRGLVDDGQFICHMLRHIPGFLALPLGLDPCIGVIVSDDGVINAKLLIERVEAWVLSANACMCMRESIQYHCQAAWHYGRAQVKSP